MSLQDTASSVGVLDGLREVTGAVHQALHVHPFMLEHFESGLTPTAYFGFLLVFQELWSDFERAMDHLSDEPWCEIASNKSLLIDMDLEPLSPEMSFSTPLSARDPRLEDEAHHALGYAYTLIGSSMGAALLSKSVKAQLPRVSTHYLCAPDARSEWRALHRYLSSLEVDCARQHCIQQGALLCFARVQEGFDRLLETLSSTCKPSPLQP